MRVRQSLNESEVERVKRKGEMSRVSGLAIRSMAKKRSKGVIGSKSGGEDWSEHTKGSLSIKKRRERKEKRDGRVGRRRVHGLFNSGTSQGSVGKTLPGVAIPLRRYVVLYCKKTGAAIWKPITSLVFYCIDVFGLFRMTTHWHFSPLQLSTECHQAYICFTCSIFFLPFCFPVVTLLTFPSSSWPKKTLFLFLTYTCTYAGSGWWMAGIKRVHGPCDYN